MPGMAVRKFACALCGEHFTLLEGDLVLPGPRLCDECVSQHWEGGQQNPELPPDIRAALDSLRAEWPDLTALLAARAADRQIG